MSHRAVLGAGPLSEGAHEVCVGSDEEKSEEEDVEEGVHGGWKRRRSRRVHKSRKMEKMSDTGEEMRSVYVKLWKSERRDREKRLGLTITFEVWKSGKWTVKNSEESVD